MAAPSSTPKASKHPHQNMSFIAFLSSLPLRQPNPLPRITPSRHKLPLALAPPPTPPKAPPTPVKSFTLPETATPIITKPTLPASQPPQQSPLSYLWPRLLLLTVAVIWGTNFPVVKLLQTPPGPLPVPTAALARFTLAAVSMIPFIPAELKAANRDFFPKPFLASTFFIGLAVSAGYFSQGIALTTTDASTSAFICSLAVVIVPLLNRFANLMGWIPKSHDRGILATWAAPLIAVIGVAMLEFGGTPPSIGDAWAFVQAAGFALGFVLNDRLAVKYPDLVFSQSALQLNVVAALALLWTVVDSSATAGTLTFPHISDAFMHGPNALAIMYTGLITTALTVWMENLALKKVSAGELAVLLSTEPFWAAALAAMLLGETMGSWAVAGGALILVACLVNQAGGTNIPDLFKSGNRNMENKRQVKNHNEALIDVLKKDKYR